jgi:hypothetical protein
VRVKAEALYQGVKASHRLPGFQITARQGGVVRMAEAQAEVR